MLLHSGRCHDRLLRVYHFAVALEVADLPLVFERFVTDALRFARRRVVQADAGTMDRRLFVYDTAGNVSLRIRARVTLHDVDALDEDVVVGEHAQHRTALTLIAARPHDPRSEERRG